MCVFIFAAEDLDFLWAAVVKWSFSYGIGIGGGGAGSSDNLLLSRVAESLTSPHQACSVGVVLGIVLED